MSIFKITLKVPRVLHVYDTLCHFLDWAEYQYSRKSVKRALINAERSYTHHEVLNNKQNSRSLWKAINRAIPSKDKERQTYTKNLTVLANEFNQFFSMVGKNTADSSRHLAEENNITTQELSSDADTSLAPGKQFNLKPVTCEEVRRVVTSLPLNKSPGPDKVSARILKDCLPVIL